jgi:hypothetical protein
MMQGNVSTNPHIPSRDRTSTGHYAPLGDFLSGNGFHQGDDADPLTVAFLQANRVRDPDFEVGDQAVRRAAKQESELDRTITLVQAVNPKRPGSASYERYEHYRNARTVREFLKAGGTKADIAHDTAKGFITLG